MRGGAGIKGVRADWLSAFPAENSKRSREHVWGVWQTKIFAFARRDRTKRAYSHIDNGNGRVLGENGLG